MYRLYLHKERGNGTLAAEWISEAAIYVSKYKVFIWSGGSVAFNFYFAIVTMHLIMWNVNSN